MDKKNTKKTPGSDKPNNNKKHKGKPTARKPNTRNKKIFCIINTNLKNVKSYASKKRTR